MRFPTAQTVAIGDGANDLPMIKAAGLGIAYHAKPKVNEQAEVTIRHADLMGVFCILGQHEPKVRGKRGESSKTRICL